jgi:hypothetical protein
MSDFFELIRVVLDAIDRAVGLDRPGWRIFALIISPIVTLVAFYLNQRGRRELKEQAQELGVLQQRVWHRGTPIQESRLNAVVMTLSR